MLFLLLPMVTIENTISFVLLAWGSVGLFNYIPEFYYLPHTSQFA